MKTLPDAVTTELNADYNYLVYLIQLQLSSGTVYLTNADMDVYDNLDSNRQYIPYGMDLGAMECSITQESDKLTLELDNTDLRVSSWVMTEEVRGKTFLLYVAVLDANMAVVGKQLMFFGLIDTISRVNKKSGTVEIFNHTILWKQRIPRRNHSPNCQWTFKDTGTCRYSGSFTTCDRSWEQCVQRGNALHFSGFRWLPGLVDKQVWFGKGSSSSSGGPSLLSSGGGMFSGSF